MTMAVARRLPLRPTPRKSFQASAVFGVVVSIALAILVAVMLRQPRATLEAQREAA